MYAAGKSTNGWYECSKKTPRPPDGISECGQFDIYVCGPVIEPEDHQKKKQVNNAGEKTVDIEITFPTEYIAWC